MNKIQFLLSIFLFFVFLQAEAQRNCGTVEYMNQLKNAESKEVFEQWVLEKRANLPASGQQSFNEQFATTIYQIPIVVHVIHNGEPIGTGTNISEAQILSQLEVLNKDFRKLNADSINIPLEFKPLYADIGFEFVLALRDPNNQATNGITRTLGSKTIWYQYADDIELKSQIIWPTTDYLNIWVAPLGNNMLGWAQFPESSLLIGMDPPFTESTDGVVITYNAFGSIDIDPSANLLSRFDLGRTATHEIGHYFGLRHIWGDGGCGIDDYVTDTPLAEIDYGGCPNMGATTTSCGSQDMFMNYMDYVDDGCMNIFSLGQKERMLIVMENSPRRLSLTTSAALIPVITCEDMALVSFTSPNLGICYDLITPRIIIKNTGYCIINSAQISLSINNSVPVIQDFNFTLDVNTSIELTFNSIVVQEYGNLLFTAQVVSVNGAEDKYIDNNTLSQTSLRAESVSNLIEDFSTSNTLWSVRTNQAVSSIDKVQSVFYSITNTAAVFNYYKSIASTDSYISPKLSIGNNPQTLLFDIAFGSRENIEDKLLVLISTDCGITFKDTLFNSSSALLETNLSPVAFYPSGAEDWQHFQADLSNYLNQDVIFSFTGESAGGNRILVDNIQVVDNSYSDMAIIGLTSPAIVCDNQNEINLWIENKGKQAVTSLNMETKLGTTISTLNYSSLSILPGEKTSITLPISDLMDTTLLEVAIKTADDNSTNNTFSQLLIPVAKPQPIPFREKFNDSILQTGWFLTGKGTDQEQGWALKNNMLEFEASQSPAKGLKELIILPPLNLENLNSASMHFDFAYAYDGTHEELLSVQVSTNCGASYETVLEQGVADIYTNLSSTSWVPVSDSDWRDIYVDLTKYAGNDHVQIIIELTSAQGNNAYINNVELFASDISDPLQISENSITVYPNPAINGLVKFTFNLTNPQPATLLVYNAQGRFVFDMNMEIALNQTFEVNTVNLQNGMYFVRLVGDQIDISRSFIVNQ